MARQILPYLDTDLVKKIFLEYRKEKEPPLTEMLHIRNKKGKWGDERRMGRRSPLRKDFAFS